MFNVMSYSNTLKHFFPIIIALTMICCFVALNTQAQEMEFDSTLLLQNGDQTAQ